MSIISVSIPVLSDCSAPVCFSLFPLEPLAVSCIPLPFFTLELRLKFAIRFAIHTLYHSHLTHADTVSVSILRHSMLTFGFSVARKCSPSRSTYPIANQYSPTSSHFLLNLIVVMSLGTPNIIISSTLPSQSFLLHPPCLAVFPLISSDNISRLFVCIMVGGNVQVTETSQF